MSATTRAACGDANRASYPTMTPRLGSSYFKTYDAIAPATRLMFSKVKSSAIMPRRPRSQVVPSKVRRQTEDISSLFSLCRTWFEHSIVHADVFAFGIALAKCAGKFAAAECLRDLFQQSCGHRQMFA